MKIFFINEINSSTFIKIEKNNGDAIVLCGKCHDYGMPAYGLELNDKSQKLLIKWLSTMNEFTKEELQAIHYDLVRNENPWQCGESIINKIQSMIDNYDEKNNK